MTFVVVWPRIAAVVVISIPVAISCVAAVWRVLCKLVVPMPAFFAILTNALVAAFGVSSICVSVNRLFFKMDSFAVAGGKSTVTFDLNSPAQTPRAAVHSPP